MNNELIIKGSLVLPNEVLYNAYVTVKEGIISSISNHMPQEQEIKSDNFIDATDKYIFPGIVDAHVHCYSVLQEGFSNATRSAAAGGVTTIIEMPYDANELICTESLFNKKKKRIQNEAIVDVALLATIAPKDGLDQIPLLAKAGACGFKVSLFNTDSSRFPKIDEGELYEAFQMIQETNRPVGVHAETDSIVNKYIQKNKDNGDDPKAHGKSRPKVSESTAALTVLEMAHYAKVKLHLYHCTFPRVIELANYYKKQNTDVSVETCTHYLTYSEDDMATLKGMGKINPPLRSEEDKEALWSLLAKNKIDMVTSDHAPWPLAKKQHDNIFSNASGAPGVEMLFPILFSEGVYKKRISSLQLAKLLSENPANRFGLGHSKGKIQVGYDADFVIIDPTKEEIIDENNMHTTSEWSPYHGRKINGKVLHTFVRGTEVYNGNSPSEEAIGKFVHAKFN